MSVHNFKDLSGQRFGRLTVMSRYGSQKRMAMWLCKCDCGVERIVRSDHLRTQKIRSCGCLRVDSNSTHRETLGRTRTTEFQIWLSMRARCNNPNEREFARYGGRGIKVCAAWDSDFSAFLADVGRRPSVRHSIDRIDNNGPYAPGNVRWATTGEQLRNTRRNVRIDYDGRSMCLTDWASHTGINAATLRTRIRNGWTVRDALTMPVNPLYSHRRKPQI